MKLETFKKYINKKSQATEVCSTGFRHMDSMLRHNGLPTDVLAYVMAKSGTGKTYFAVNWIYNLLMMDKKVLFLSYEMSYIAILDILFSIHQDVTLKEIDAITYDAEIDELLINKEGKRLPIENISIRDIPQSLIQIEKTIEFKEPDFVFVDHLHLVKASTDDLHLKTIEVSGNFRGMKRTYNTRIIALIQLNRSSSNEGDKFPVMTDMKGSSSLEEDADILLALKRQDVKNPDAQPIIDACFRKNRLSGQKQAIMSWDYRYGYSGLKEQ